jgi:hypothetical protein
MINKKGDMLTPAQLVIIVLAVIGLVMGIFILYSLNLKGEADDSACRLSVLSRAGTGSVLPGATQSFIPLKCTTKKICITTGAQCGEFAGEQGVSTVVIPKNNVAEAAKIIEKTNIESRYDCWKLMGEGKLDIFPGNDATILSVFGKAWDVTKPTCFICSRIALSKEFRDMEVYYDSVQRAVDFDKYAATNYPENSQKTYLKLFTNDVVSSYGTDYVTSENKLPAQSAYLFTQIITRGSPWSKFTQTGIGTGVALIVGSSGKVFGSVPAAVTSLAVTGVSASVSGLSQWMSQQNSNTLCGSLSSKNDNLREGCSIVGRYDYNNEINKINSNCYMIEGNP